MLGFLILPLVWSVPEALITAEMSTAFPENRCGPRRALRLQVSGVGS